MHQRSFARFKLSQFEEVRPNGKEGLRQCGRLNSVKPARPGQTLCGRNGAEFGISAAIGQCSHPIADFPSLHACAQFHDLTGHFKPQNRACPGWRWIGPLPRERESTLRPPPGSAPAPIPRARPRGRRAAPPPRDAYFEFRSSSFLPFELSFERFMTEALSSSLAICPTAINGTFRICEFYYLSEKLRFE